MKKNISFFGVVLSFIIAIPSCAPKPPEKPVAAAPKHIAANVAPAIEDQVLEQINRYRQSKKLPPLVANPAIEFEARRHSLEMATKKVQFSHNGFSARMKNIQRKIPNVTAVSENVAVGSLTAQAVVEGWIKSTEHRRNIEGNYRITGIGVARNEQNQLYFTQIFAN
jgi:uncharacterized protein YkwD